MLNYGLSGRVVVVTGGASGIGLASVLALVRDGAHVAVLDTNETGVNDAVAQAKQVAAASARVVGAVVDVRDVESLQRAAALVQAELGPAWGLIVCAGIATSNRAEDIPMQEWDNMFAVNVSGAFATCQVFGRQMIDERRGSIILLGSVDSLGGQPGRTHYTASKHAVLGILKNLAIEWGRHGIRVNGLAPSPVDSPMVRRGLPPAFIDNVVHDRTPLGRMAKPTEIASAALMLLSDAASFVHGVMLPVDGGLITSPFIRRQGADIGSKRLLDAGVYQED